MMDIPPVHPPSQQAPGQRSDVPWALLALALTATAVGSLLIPFLSLRFREILAVNGQSIPWGTIVAMSRALWPIMPVLTVLSIVFAALPIRRRTKVWALLVVLGLALALGVAFMGAILYPVLRNLPLFRF